MSVTGQASPSLLKNILDNGISSTAVSGQLILIEPGLRTIAVNAVSAANNTVTMDGGINHFPVGSKVRISAGVGGILPTPLVATQDYFVILGNSNGEIGLCLTLADAIASDNYNSYSVNITDGGALPLNILEQPLDRNTPIAQLVQHEIKPANVSGYERKPIQFSAGAVGTNKANKPPVLGMWTIGSTALDYSAWAIIWDAVSIPGDMGGTGFVYASDGVTRTIAANDTGGVTVNVSLLN
jgi:hypothetical protein